MVSPAKIIITGVTGTAVDSPSIGKVIALTRRAPNLQHEKLEVILHQDFLSYPPELMAKLSGATGVIWALGTSMNGIKKEDYEMITEGYTLSAAKAFATLGSPERPFTFAHLSGQGANWKGSGPLFARVKGRTEKQLAELDTPAFKVYNFRAAGIDPAANAQDSGRKLELYKRILIPPLRFIWPSLLIKADVLGAAMLKSIVTGLPGKGGAEETGVLDNEEIKAIGAQHTSRDEL